jgi:hypothetical protein
MTKTLLYLDVLSLCYPVCDKEYTIRQEFAC